MRLEKLSKDPLPRVGTVRKHKTVIMDSDCSGCKPFADYHAAKAQKLLLFMCPFYE